MRRPSRLGALIALVLGLGAAVGAPGASALTFTTPGPAPRSGTETTPPPPVHPGPASSASPAAQLSAGHALYRQHCASCHGFDMNGRGGLGMSLRGAGEGPVEFYLSTGRMPLNDPKQEPMRQRPIFDQAQRGALAAYIHEVAGGPPSPDADPSRGSLSQGFKLFDENCAGCHSIVARGGIAVDAQVPDLSQATPRQIAEAVRMGPYVMPHFTSAQLDQHDLDSLARYIVWTRKPDDAGGWGIFNIGPVPEGIVAWFIGLLALVIVAHLIGERTA